MYNVPGQITNPMLSSSPAPYPSVRAPIPTYQTPNLPPFHPAYYSSRFQNPWPLRHPYFPQQRPQHPPPNTLSYHQQPPPHPLIGQQHHGPTHIRAQSYGLPHRHILETIPQAIGIPSRLNIQPNRQSVPYNNFQGVGFPPPNPHSISAHGFQPPNHLLRPTSGFPYVHDTCRNYQNFLAIASNCLQTHRPLSANQPYTPRTGPEADAYDFLQALLHLHTTLPLSMPSTTLTTARSPIKETTTTTSTTETVPKCASTSTSTKTATDTLTISITSTNSTNSTTSTTSTPTTSNGTTTNPKKIDRYTFTDEVEIALEYAYLVKPFAPKRRREEISKTLKIPQRAVKLWFADKEAQMMKAKERADA